MYALGMNYTDSALKEGFCKSLVNIDFRDGGTVIAPRASLRPNRVAVQDPKLPSADGIIASDKRVPIAAKQLTVTLTDNNSVTTTELRDVIIVAHMATATSINEVPSLYAVDFSILECLPQKLPHKIIDTEEAQIDTHCFTETKPTAGFKIFIKAPLEANIHDIPVANSNLVASAIGTFGFNDTYYYFGKDNSGIGMFSIAWDNTTKKFKITKLGTKELTAKEAVMWGYNMLATNPYQFQNRVGGAIIDLQGMLPYAAGTTNLLMSPSVNTDLDLQCFYMAPTATEYKSIWEWKDLSGTSWNEIGKMEFTSPADLKMKFNPPTKELMVRITVRKKATPDIDPPEKVLTVGFSFDKTSYGNTANVSPKKYTLQYSKGMTYWRNRLVTWGVPEDPNILFMSEVNDPTYFPYPNYADVFTEPIKHVITYGDNLLVFTATQVHMVALAQDGLSYTTTLLQNNLRINDWDYHLIQVVKNMVFFKSGNYYYMIVPKTGTIGALQLAPISGNISTLLDRFKNETRSLFEELYYEDEENLQHPLVHYYNYLDGEDVYNTYVFSKTNKTAVIPNEYINVVLIYSTLRRAWRMYVYESNSLYLPYLQDATQRGTLYALSTIQQRFLKPDSTTTTTTAMVIEFFKFTFINTKDLFLVRNGTYAPPIVNNSGVVVAQNATSDFTAMCEAATKFKNVQYLDTGYRDHDSVIKKRYREVQFVLNNKTSTRLSMYADFMIDGEVRRNHEEYVMQHNTDPSSPDYLTIYMERRLADPLELPGTTVFAKDATDETYWQLDVSMFPSTTTWKLRVPVSGKGFVPRLKFYSYNERSFELNSISWIYRIMNSR